MHRPTNRPDPKLTGSVPQLNIFIVYDSYQWDLHGRVSYLLHPIRFVMSRGTLLNFYSFHDT